MRKHPLATCEECPLYEDGAFVPTQNLKPRSKIAVVGEAPGAHEARDGIPFTGPSGQLLEQVLTHHGYYRENIMISNMTLCRSVDSTGANVDPPKTALAACAPRLAAELDAGEVEKILAVGGVAATNLINTKKTITNLRIGGPKPFKYNEEIEVVATWHPAYCLRAPDNFPNFVDDVAKLRNWKDKLPYPEPKYWVFDTEEKAKLAIERLMTVDGPLVIDIESGIDKDNDVVHPDNYELLCLGVCFAKGKAAIFPGNIVIALWESIRKLLRSKPIIAHNGKFDLGGLYPILGDLDLAGDTMLMSYSQNERPGHHGLKKLSIEKLNAPDYEETIRQYVPRGGNYADIPRHILYKYNAYDVACTWDLYYMFSADMDDRAHQVHNFLITASNAVRQLERAGIFFDTEYNEKLAKEFTSELFDLELELADVANRPINPRSWQQIQRFLTDNGVVVSSTEADVLEEVLPYLTGHVQQFIGKLLVHRKRAKVFGTYIKGMAKRVHEGKVYTTFSLHGTTSGRLASRNPNLQNIIRDKRIKRQFIVENKGNIFIQVDYSQLEGRVITALAQDEYLRGIFSDPERDLFNELTTSVYGPGHLDNETRVKIKSVFYGNAYGRGPTAIAQELGIPEKEARDLVRNFKEVIPATIAWQASIKHKVLSGEDLITPFGRRRSFYLITDQNKHDIINEALSFLPQSIASDICVTALIELRHQLSGLATIRLTVHDALYFECSRENQEQVVSIASKAMVDAGLAFTDYLPFAVDVKTGTDLGYLT